MGFKDDRLLRSNVNDASAADEGELATRWSAVLDDVTLVGVGVRNIRGFISLLILADEVVLLDTLKPSGTSRWKSHPSRFMMDGMTSLDSSTSLRCGEPMVSNDSRSLTLRGFALLTGVSNRWRSSMGESNLTC